MPHIASTLKLCHPKNKEAGGGGGGASLWFGYLPSPLKPSLLTRAPPPTITFALAFHPRASPHGRALTPVLSQPATCFAVFVVLLCVVFIAFVVLLFNEQQNNKVGVEQHLNNKIGLEQQPPPWGSADLD